MGVCDYMTPQNETKHNKAVRKVANDHKKNGYNVHADIPGFKKPAGIGKDNRIPDVVATKNGRTKIVEVETPTSLRTDKKQQSTFRRSAAHRKNTTFHTEVTSKKKR